MYELRDIFARLYNWFLEGSSAWLVLSPQTADKRQQPKEKSTKREKKPFHS
jgi:hypothetical protein